jgi:hypothetical protein
MRHPTATAQAEGSAPTTARPSRLMRAMGLDRSVRASLPPRWRARERAYAGTQARACMMARKLLLSLARARVDTTPVPTAMPP